MNTIKFNINWRIALLIFVLSSTVSPYISSLYHGYVGLTLMVVLSLIVLFSGKAGNRVLNSALALNKNNRPLLVALLWFIFGIAFTFLRGANDFGYLVQVIFLPVYYFLGLFLAQNERYHNYATLAIITFIFINIVFAGESISSTTSAREIYMESNQSLTAGTTGFWGLIGIFFPIFFIVVFKLKKNLLKFGYGLVLLVLLYKLFFSGFATPIGLLSINFALIGMLFFIYNINKSARFFRVLFIIIFFLGSTYLLINTILQSQSSALAGVQWRFNNFIENPQGGGYSGNLEEGSRLVLLQFSWNTFMENPLLGGGGNIRTSIYEGVAGGHSSAVDFLAVLGLLGGGGAFIYFVFISFKNAKRQIKPTKSFNNICHLATVITFIIGGIMNPYWQGPILASFLLIINIYKVPNSI